MLVSTKQRAGWSDCTDTTVPGEVLPAKKIVGSVKEEKTIVKTVMDNVVWVLEWEECMYQSQVHILPAII